MYLRQFISLSTLICFSLLFFNCTTKNNTADLVLINGNVISVDKQNTVTEAIAISSDTIMAIGLTTQINTLIGDSTKIIDLKGKTVIPGFIDSHAHLIGTGKAKINLNLKTARNWDEVVYLVADAASKTRNGDWIIGRGWHQEKWDQIPLDNVNGYPIHTNLSKATPDNPVMLSHASGHAVFANNKAMEIANITIDTHEPKGGKILRDSEGEAIGVFTEEAELLISEMYNRYLDNRSIEEQKIRKKKVIELAMDECLLNGITTLHDAGASFKDVQVLREMADSSRLRIRLYEMLLENYKTLKDSIRTYQTVGYANNHLTVRAIKLYMDGALGSRGAWLLNPYSDSPDQYGLNVTNLSEIKNIVKLAAENDFQICTHAIGDKANRMTLDIYEDIFKYHSQYNNYRWRIEHAQHLNSQDIPRFAELGVIASMQSIHCTSDAPFVVKRLGEKRAEYGSYSWNSLKEHNALICNGTDSPVEDISPIENIYAAVTRKQKNGIVFYPDQRMSRLDALKSYTINGAYAAFEENIKGSLEVGKLADMAILSQDILTVPDEQILDTKVLFTIVGGKVLYEKLSN